jgi:hypothetical protein
MVKRLWLSHIPTATILIDHAGAWKEVKGQLKAPFNDKTEKNSHK